MIEIMLQLEGRVCCQWSLHKMLPNRLTCLFYRHAQHTHCNMFLCRDFREASCYDAFALRSYQLCQVHYIMLPKKKWLESLNIWFSIKFKAKNVFEFISSWSKLLNSALCRSLPAYSRNVLQLAQTWITFWNIMGTKPTKNNQRDSYT